MAIRIEVAPSGGAPTPPCPPRLFVGAYGIHPSHSAPRGALSLLVRCRHPTAMRRTRKSGTMPVMRALRARVENGRYVIDEPAVLPEGTEVQLQLITGDELDDEERAALHASLERAADDSEAGRKMDAWEHLKQYRARRAG